MVKMVGVDLWDVARMKIGPYAPEERLHAFFVIFEKLLKDMSNKNACQKHMFGIEEASEASEKKKKNTKFEILVDVLPSKFLDYIEKARGSWKCKCKVYQNLLKPCSLGVGQNHVLQRSSVGSVTTPMCKRCLPLA